MSPLLVVEWDDPIEGERLGGTLVNSAYCPVNGCWHLLVAGSDGTIKHLRSDTLGAEIYGIEEYEEEQGA